MQSKNQENRKIYLDSNIWFSYITEGEYDNDFAKTNEVFETIIKDENAQAFSSQLITLEMLNVIRKRVTQREKFSKKLKYDKFLEKKIRGKINGFHIKFVDVISRWEASGKLTIVPVNITVTSLFKQVIDLHNCIDGKMKDVSRCNICGNYDYSGYDYKGADHYDLQHMLIAKSGGATQLVTFDKGFDEVRQKKMNDGLEIKILNLDP